MPLPVRRVFISRANPPRSSRLTATAVIALVGALALAGIQPAAAASKKPGTVRLVSFTAAALGGSNASLTISWPRASRATKYEIYVSRSYSMSNKKKFSTRSRVKKITRLVPGADYFFQVRAVNGKKAGNKSARVGHRTIVAHAPAAGRRYRVMTYNVCSDVCGGFSKRQPGVMQRVAAYRPDILSTQEAGGLAVPPGYTEAVYKSAKRLFFKTSRFTGPQLAEPAPAQPAKVSFLDKRTNGTTKIVPCAPTWANGRAGYVFLGFHGDKDRRGCRYAVWSELTDRQNGKRIMVVNVHTVTGNSAYRVADRATEMSILTRTIAAQNPKKLQVLYSGDFNSYKGRPNDSVGKIMNRAGYADTYDLSQKLTRQHLSSFNGFARTARVSVKWGDHIDHIWMMPKQGRVVHWLNGANLKKDKHVGTIPSDHNPIVVDLTLR